MKPTKAVGERTPGDLEALRARLWDAVEAAHSLLKSRKTETKLRAIHAVSQSSAAYRNLLETADLAERLKVLEDQLGADRES